MRVERRKQKFVITLFLYQRFQVAVIFEEQLKVLIELSQHAVYAAVLVLLCIEDGELL